MIGKTVTGMLGTCEQMNDVIMHMNDVIMHMGWNNLDPEFGLPSSLSKLSSTKAQ
jgi:hypothetical protein